MKLPVVTHKGLPGTQRNRATSTQVLSVASNTKGTTNHAPKTESRRSTLPAPEIGIQGPSIQWRTPTSILFWKAHGWGHRSATPKWTCLPLLSSNIGQEIWPSLSEQLLTIPHFSEPGDAFLIHLPDFVRGASSLSQVEP